MTEFDQKNPYDVLGIPHGCSIELIKATYKSLIKVFHPDVFRGDRDFAVTRMAEINAAYEYLSDEPRKAKYDEFLSRSNDNGHRENYDPDKENNEFSHASDILQDKWLFACEYHPELKVIHENLSKLDTNSGALFIILMVEEQLFANAQDVADELENQFLQSKFGTDPEVLSAAKFSILNKKFKFAQQLNKALKILGQSSKEQIFLKLAEDLPDFATEVFTHIGRRDLVKNIKHNPTEEFLLNWETEFDRATQSGKILSMKIILEKFGYTVNEDIIDKSGFVARPKDIFISEPHNWTYNSNFELMSIMSVEKKMIRKYIIDKH